MRLIALTLLLCGCRPTVTVPAYAEVPPSKVVVDVEEKPDFVFSYPIGPDNNFDHVVAGERRDGWTEIRGLPQIENFEQMSNYWFRRGIASYYVSNVIFVKKEKTE